MEEIERLKQKRLERQEKAKKYREKSENKEKRKEWQSKICECECGGKYTLPHKGQHMSSLKHITYLENKMADKQK
jgi:hypothetical protein